MLEDPPPPPFTLEHLPDLKEALIYFREQYPEVIGDLFGGIGKHIRHRRRLAPDWNRLWVTLVSKGATQS